MGVDIRLHKLVRSLTGKAPYDKNHAISLLIQYLHSVGAGEYVIDDDIQMVLDLVEIHGEVSIDPAITQMLLDKKNPAISNYAYERTSLRNSPRTKDSILNEYAVRFRALYPYLFIILSGGKMSISRVDSLSSDIVLDQMAIHPRDNTLYSVRVSIKAAATMEELETILPHRLIIGDSVVWNSNGRPRRMIGSFFFMSQVEEILKLPFLKYGRFHRLTGEVVR